MATVKSSDAVPSSAMPRHVAIIMDGNNRWAKQRRLHQVAAGHRAGVETIRTMLDACDRHGVKILTLYAFSSENWLRPRSEVEALMALFSNYLSRELPELHRRGVRMRFIGRRERFSTAIQRKITACEDMTQDNLGRVLVIAADYGGHWDIAQAARSLAHDVAAGELQAGDIDEQVLGSRICLSDLPAPDLLIRTGGDHRISNFLLWQCAYAEFYFTEKYWPDFGEQDFVDALTDFVGRERRFGKASPSLNASPATSR